jgi:uncharacterized protein (DUF885 family)
MQIRITRIISKLLLVCLIWLVFFSGQNKDVPFSEFISSFPSKYRQLNIPDFQYDYKEYFKSIPGLENLKAQEDFFTKGKESLSAYSNEKLKSGENIIYEHLDYEINFNLQRIQLEKEWVSNGRKIPVNGLHELKNKKNWYGYFTKKFTGLDLTPEEIMDMGMREVQKVQNEIKKIRVESGFSDSIAFNNYLNSEVFIIRDKQKIIEEFNKTDSTIRKHLNEFIGKVNIPKVYPVEWADAGPNTPPGIYLNHEFNSYGKDVFQFNFYGNRYNLRAVEWLYMHEAIPGHHLQFSIRNSAKTDSIQELFLYPGNFEGWACYVEYEGKKLGLYRDAYSYLGKWEWDLVRSVRLVLDAGIHYYGWTREEALAYWKKNIAGQDEIAEREITRVTNWTAQALSYKAGSLCIMNLKEDLKKKYGSKFDERKFHRCYLSYGMRPLAVIKDNFEMTYFNSK